MTEQLVVRYLIESIEGTYCAYGYSVHNDLISVTEGDGVVHDIPLKDVIRVVRESITSEDITESIKENVEALV